MKKQEARSKKQEARKKNRSPARVMLDGDEQPRLMGARCSHCCP
ncbi:hypothetical protein [Okeania sp. SIO1I7]|nr:hypothetical protein [Okeania sp. SIO1I7]